MMDSRSDAFYVSISCVPINQSINQSIKTDLVYIAPCVVSESEARDGGDYIVECQTVPEGKLKIREISGKWLPKQMRSSQSSSLFLNIFTEKASTTFVGREFQSSPTGCEKKNFRIFNLHGTASDGDLLYRVLYSMINWISLADSYWYSPPCESRVIQNSNRL